MATLKVVGPLVANDTASSRPNDVVDVDYVNSLLAANMTSQAATARITADLSAYAASSYITSAISGLATPAYVRNQAAGYVPLANIGQPNGPVALGTLGKVSPGLISAPSTQQWPAPFYSPTGYQTTTVTAYTPVQLFTQAQSYPGFNYRLLCTGIMDGQVPTTDNPSVFPQVLIRQGSTTGPIIAFGYGVAESYQWGIATLGAASTAQLGTTNGWAQYYTSTASGVWATAAAGVASWIRPSSSSVAAASCRCRNLDPVFGTTTSSYQAVSMTIGSAVNQGSPATNDIYVRMDDTGTYYVRCKLTNTTAGLYYSLGGGGGAETQIGSSVTSGVSQATGTTYTLYAGNFAATLPRQFQLYKTVGSTTTLVGTWNDTNNASALGTPYRGWGFGAGIGQTTFFGIPSGNNFPSSISAVTIADPANPAAGVNSGEIVILPVALAAQTTQTAATTLYVMLQSSDQSASSKSVSVSPNQPGLAVIPLPWAA